MGVGASEAIRKTDFDVYQKVIDAAFQTPTMTGFTINGAWRPDAGDYVRVKGALPPGVKQPWGSGHVNSRALDINKITYKGWGDYEQDMMINNGVTAQRKKVTTTMPWIVGEFSNNLRAQGNWSQEFNPWVVRSSPSVESPNRNQSPNESLHRHHLHISYR